MSSKFHSGGFRTFILVWFGQTISLIGSGLTAFSLGLWVYDHTGAVTPFAINTLSAVLPMILLSPLAGVVVDRLDRRSVMLISDLGAGLSTLAVALLLAGGNLEVWHVFLATAVNASFNAFQLPAYLAATSQLVPDQHLTRAGGMMQIASAVSDILAPTLAGLLIVTIQISGVILIDVATFLFAVTTLAFVRFPDYRKSEAEPSKPILKEMGAGWAYIRQHRGLVGLLVLSIFAYFAIGMIGALLVPMLRTYTTASTLGLIISIAGGGMLVGSLVMSAWGGPKRRVNGVLIFEFVKGIGLVLIGLRPTALIAAIGAATAHFSMPVVNAANQAIWQSKAPAEIQGRVFAARQMIARAAMPIALILAGPLADTVFEPLMADGGQLAGLLGPVFGVGTGRGMGLLFSLMGVLLMLVSILGSLFPAIREVDDSLPETQTPAIRHGLHSH